MESCNFGFSALDVFDCLPEDSGTYTCRARNALGEAVTSCELLVEGIFCENVVTIQCI